MISRVHRRGFVALTCVVLAAAQGCGGSSQPSAPPNAQLAVTSVSPTELPLGGGSVTIRGSGFDPGTRVLFGAGAADAVTYISATELDAVAPPHVEGAVDVGVENPDGGHADLAKSLLYVATPPTLASISPATGPTAGGTKVVLSGVDFGAGATVAFGATPAAVVSVTASTIEATTPAHLVGAADVTVTNPDGQSATLAAAFTYAVPPPPSVGVTSPNSGTSNGGAVVTVNGLDFLPGAAVTFGGTPGVVTSVTASAITVTTPAHAAGAVAVAVVNADGQTSSLAAAYTYTAPAPPATGVTLAPNLASPQIAGTYVTFTASGLGSSAYEYRFFQSTDAGVTYAPVQDWSIAPSWTMPASLTAGTYRIRVDVRTSPTVATFDAQTAIDYVLSVAPLEPFIASPSPIAGSTAGSTTVTISGGNFVPGSAVYFGGVPQRVIGTTSTTITIVTSPGVAGLVDVSVVTPSNQAAVLPSGFEYILPSRTPPQPPPPPPPGPLPPSTGVTLAAAQPSPRIAGTFVPFVAAGRGSTGYQYRFWLSADGGLTFALTQDWSFASTWTTPASLAAGTYRIQVDVRTNVGAVDASATTSFTLTAAPPTPVIAALTPKTGSTAGTTAVTVTGFNFLPGVVVRFGTTRQTVRTVTPTAVTIITASGAAGLVDVVVVNPTNQGSVLLGGYDYTLPVR